jgi:hypothetical protein
VIQTVEAITSTIVATATNIGGFTMSILARFTPQGMTNQQYDDSITRLKAAGAFPPDGLEYHVCFGSDGDLRVSEIWESQEKMAAFAERLMPILAEAGINPGEPEFLEVYSSVKG